MTFPTSRCPASIFRPCPTSASSKDQLDRACGAFVITHAHRTTLRRAFSTSGRVQGAGLDDSPLVPALLASQARGRGWRAKKVAGQQSTRQASASPSGRSRSKAVAVTHSIPEPVFFFAIPHAARDGAHTGDWKSTPGGLRSRPLTDESPGSGRSASEGRAGDDVRFPPKRLAEGRPRPRRTAVKVRPCRRSIEASKPSCRVTTFFLQCGAVSGPIAEAAREAGRQLSLGARPGP